MSKSNCFESSVVKKPVINHINKTIVVSDLFFKETAKPFTNEFYDLMKLREVLPDYEVITRSHRKPRPPKEPEKVKKFVSYTKMKTYIELLDNKDKLILCMKEVAGRGGYYGKLSGAELYYARNHNDGKRSQGQHSRTAYL